jgi:hypothetical protein
VFALLRIELESFFPVFSPAGAPPPRALLSLQPLFPFPPPTVTSAGYADGGKREKREATVAARGYRYGLESGSEIRIQAKAVTTSIRVQRKRKLKLKALTRDSDLPSSPNPNPGGVRCDYKSESSAML